jgi:3-oxoacyl-[acyl-carrier protein] reductase
MSTLRGKVALVTGGSYGTGASTARALAADGADVAISYDASAADAEAIVRELEKHGVRAAAFAADLAAIDELMRAVVERFGRLDILSTTPRCPTTVSAFSAATGGRFA